LFYAINWIREMINSYATKANCDETKAKLFHRFAHLAKLENDLESIIATDSGRRYLASIPRLTTCTTLTVVKIGASSSSGGKAKVAKPLKLTSTTSGAAKRKMEAETRKAIQALYRPFRPCVLDLLDAPSLAQNTLACHTLVLSTEKLVLSNLATKRVSGFSKGSGSASKKSVLDAGDLLVPHWEAEHVVVALKGIFPQLRSIVDTVFEELSRELGSESVLEEAGRKRQKLQREILIATASVLRTVLQSRVLRGSKQSRKSLFQALSQFATPGCENHMPSEIADEVFEVVLTWLGRGELIPSLEAKLGLVDVLVELSKLGQDATSLNTKISEQCHRLLAESCSEEGQSPNKQVIARLLDLHIRKNCDPLFRCEQVILDLESIAASDKYDKTVHGETYETLTRANIVWFFEPVLKSLSLVLETTKWMSVVPQSSTRQKRKASKAAKGAAGKRAKRRADDDEDGGDDDDDDDDDEENDPAESDASSNEEDVANVQVASPEEGEQNENENEGHDESENEGENENKDEQTKPLLAKSGFGDVVAAPTHGAAESVEDFYIIANTAAMLVKRLVLLTRSLDDKKTLLSVAVKQGRQFVERFVKLAIPFLSFYYKTSPKNVQVCLAAVQSSTRQLQSICEYGKESKDSAMMSAVPQLRRLIENLTYSAKKICTTNNCIDLFSTGSLKRRTVDGALVQTNPVPQDED